MRILLILLIAGLCLVTAKYIPQDLNDVNSVVYRVRRSDSQDSDSNTASVERNDDSSNDNDNENSEDNDSSEKIIEEERNKDREKEEKKKQKLLEKLEKEKQKEIEEKRKLEEKLAKELRKEQERKEKEERKLQEKLKKERQKLEEENRKLQEKIEKDQRKRQEKLKKQLEELQKEQKESAEDTYLETEEEDSVEMEDIWKVHVYDKYGINITSTKLERQAALQRYLQEEMGIDANSTKGERRKAILNLIQTKLQNDSAAIESFRNLLLSQINSAQLQKLKSKLENDLEELNNNTQILNNISLPWVSEAQQNIQEKRTFLQGIVQFLSNIVPNWFSVGETTGNPTQLNANAAPVNSPAPNSDNSTGPSGSEQSPQSVATNDNTSLNNGAADVSNLSVLPSNVAPGSPLNSPSKPNDSLDTDSVISNTQININGAPANTDSSANSGSSNAPEQANPGLTSNNPSELNGPAGTNPSNNIIGNANIDGKPVVTDNLADSGSSNGFVNNTSDTQASTNELPPLFANSANSNSLNTSSSTAAESAPDSSSQLIGSLPGNVLPDINLPIPSAAVASEPTPDSPLDPISNNGQSPNINENPEIPANSAPTSSNPSQPNEPAGNESINNNVPVSETSVNEVSTSITSPVNSNLSNASTSSNSVSSLGSPLEPSEPESSVSLNNNIPVNQIDDSGIASKSDNSVNVASLNPPTPVDFEQPSDPLTITGSASIDSVNIIVPASQQTTINELSSSTANTTNYDLSNTLTVADIEPRANTSKPEEPANSDLLNNNIIVTQTNIDNTQLNVNNSTSVNSSDIPKQAESELNVSNLTESNAPIESTIVKMNSLGGQNDGNEIQSNTNSLNVPTLSTDNSSIVSVQSTSDSVEPNEPGTNSLANGEIGISTGDVTQANPSLSDVASVLQTAESSGTNFINNNVNVSQIDSIGEYTTAATSDNLGLQNDAPNDSINLSGNYGTTNNLPSDPKEVANIPTEPALAIVSESFSPSYEADVLTASKPNSDDSSLLSVSGINDSINSSISNNNDGPIESNLANSNKTLISENGETILAESNLGVDNDIVVASDNTNGGNGALNSIDELVPTTDANTVGITVVTNTSNDASPSIDSNNSTSTATITGEPLTTNFETTDIISTNTEAVYQTSISQDGNVPNAETDIIPENTYTDGQITDILTSSVAPNDAIQAESHTEQGGLLVQEIVNTPSDLVTIASDQALYPSPPPDVVVPIEEGASIVDIKLQ